MYAKMLFNRPPVQGSLPDAHTIDGLSVRAVLMCVGYLVLWHLTHFYRGLDHDAQLYALQALAELHPTLYSNDIFFRFGSQDDFTIFTKLYACVAQSFGLDEAASILTFVLTGLTFVGAWLISKRQLGSKVAFLSVGLLIVTDLNYGGYRIFKSTEEFLTARLAAEAVALLSLWCWLTGYRAAASALLIIAALFHPLVAFPVLGIMVLARLPVSRQLIWTTIAIFVGAACLVFAILAPMPRLRLMDPDWLEIVKIRSYYLFPGAWSAEDWSRLSVIASTLVIGLSAFKESETRQLCAASLIVGAVGIALSFVSQALPVEIVVQGQPWRWTWVAGVLALLLLPGVFVRLWGTESVGNTTCVLLGASWAMFDTSGGLLAAAALAVWSLGSRLTTTAQSLLRLLSAGAVSIAAVWTVASLTVVLSWNMSFGHEPRWIEQTRNVLDLSVPALTAAVLLWLLTFRLRLSIASILMSVLLFAVVPPMAGPSVERWNARSVDSITFDEFRGWREIIPVNSEVLWLWSPIPAWLLLERPSYMSRSQGAGLLFSRELAMEIQRRADVLSVLGPRNWLIVGGYQDGDPPAFTIATLRTICVDPELSYVVNDVELEPNLGSLDWPRKGASVWLYDCDDFRAPSQTSVAETHAGRDAILVTTDKNGQ